MRLLRYVVLLMGLLLAVDSRFGTSSIEKERTPYSEVIQGNSEPQTLLNTARVANKRSSPSLDITEVDQATAIQYSTSGESSNSGVSPNFKDSAGTTVGAVGFAASPAKYQEAPNIRYEPLAGQTLTAQVSTVLPAAASNSAVTRFKAACPNPWRFEPTRQQLASLLEQQRKWLLSIGVNGHDDDLKLEFILAEAEAKHQPSPGNRPTLCNADLTKLDLKGLDFFGFDLSDADLSSTDLSNADFLEANLSNACLNKSELEGVILSNARLDNADLDGSNLSKANLSWSTLRSASLLRTNVAGADLSGVDLAGAFYAPAAGAPSANSVGMRGLDTVSYESDLTFTDCAGEEEFAGSPVGLQQLRKVFQDAGLRESERDVTFAIEHALTKSEISSWRYSGDYPWPQNWLRTAQGVLRLVLFEWTSAWGRSPTKALAAIVTIWVSVVPLYVWSIWERTYWKSGRGGLYRVWPQDRLDEIPVWNNITKVSRPQRLRTHLGEAFCWAFYFSLIATFQFGYREFSVGSWISRMQPRAFTLEPSGWIRSLSGVQSLVCLYLFAIWLLTQFGRPFQ